MLRGTVAVGYLDDGHTWAACFGVSLRNLYLRDQSDQARFLRVKELRAAAGTGTIPQARNNVVRGFLDGDAEWLFMVDTDMGFADDTVERLLRTAHYQERPVVGGLCFALRGTPKRTELNATRYLIVPTIYSYAEVDGEVGFAPMFDYPRNARVKAAGTGAACLLVHRSAAEKVRDTAGEEWFTPVTHPTGMRGKPREFSEDLSFCVRLAAADVPLTIDTSVKTTHDKGGLFLDEETYDLWRSAVPGQQIQVVQSQQYQTTDSDEVA